MSSLDEQNAAALERIEKKLEKIIVGAQVLVFGVITLNISIFLYFRFL